jgi:hypothetical protein
MTTPNADLEIARAAILATRRRVLVQLFGAAMAEDLPDRRDAIMQTISRILEGKERHARL